ncbi:hypothetical protein BHM03_00001915, partial [Ensete ventricosum]
DFRAELRGTTHPTELQLRTETTAGELAHTGLNQWSLIASAGSGSTHLLLAGGYCSSPSAVRLRPPQAVAISTNAEMTSTTRCKPLRPTPTA